MLINSQFYPACPDCGVQQIQGKLHSCAITPADKRATNCPPDAPPLDTREIHHRSGWNDAVDTCRRAIELNPELSHLDLLAHIAGFKIY